jgi:hypothetical protein
MCTIELVLGLTIFLASKVGPIFSILLGSTGKALSADGLGSAKKFRNNKKERPGGVA